MEQPQTQLSPSPSPTTQEDIERFTRLLMEMSEKDPKIRFWGGKVYLKKKVRIDGKVPRLPDQIIPQKILRLKERHDRGETLCRTYQSHLRKYGLLPDTNWGVIQCRKDINAYQKKRNRLKSVQRTLQSLANSVVSVQENK